MTKDVEDNRRSLLHRTPVHASPHRNDPPIVLAAVAHPDDIEFCFAGTLLLLRDSGCQIHMWNLADGSCGSASMDSEATAAARLREAAESASLAGATFHEPVFPDMGVFYDAPSLRRVASVLRHIRPGIILTHAPGDYMEDHQNVCRLIVSAAFARGMRNFPCDAPPCNLPVRIYHGSPHGLCDGLGRPFHPQLLVNIGSVLAEKRRMLACHKSQQEWLEASQGFGAFVEEMEGMGRAAAKYGARAEVAEGWQRHAHLGFCPADFDPLPARLASYCELLKTSNQHAHATTTQ